MPKTVLGIQIADDEALAVYLKGGWKGATVDRVARVDLSETDAESAGTALLEANLPHADSVITALPADAAFQRAVELPFSDRRKVEQAAPLEAEESLVLPLEELVCHVHILERASRHSKALLVAAPQQRVASLLELVRSAGLQPHSMDVEALALAAVAYRSLPAGRPALVLDLSPRLCQAVALGPGGPQGFHAFTAAAGDPELVPEATTYASHWKDSGLALEIAYLSGPGALDQDLDAWSQALGLPVDKLPFPSEGLTVSSDGDIPWPAWAVPLGLALREGYTRQASQINLLQGPFAPSRETGPWKRAAVWAGVYALVLLALWGAGVWSESAYKQTQYRALRDAVRQVFRDALPEVTNIVSEVDQMRARVEELENRSASLGSLVDREASPLRILREISARIPKELEVEFREMIVDEDRIRLEGTTTSFDAAEKIRAELAKYTRFRKIPPPDATTLPEPGKIKFKLFIDLRSEG